MQITLMMIELGYTYLIYKSIESVGLIDYSKPLSESSAEIWLVLRYLGLFILLRVTGSIGLTFVSFRLSLSGLNLRNALMVTIYKKLMKKCLDRDTIFDMGDITNLSQVDSQAYANLGFQASYMIGIPLRVTFGLVGMYMVIGYALLPALVVLIIVTAANAYMSLLYDKYKNEAMKVSDARGKLVNEIFKNVRFIKMIALENYYLVKLRSVRLEELFWIKKNFVRNIFNNLVNSVGPVLFLVSIYALKLKLTGTLKLSEAFVTGMIFGIFQHSLRSMAWYTVFVMDCIISGRRINFFLLSEEVNPTYLKMEGKNGKTAITVEQGNFYWVNKKSKELYMNEKMRIATKTGKGDKADGKNPKMEQEKLREIKAPLLEQEMVPIDKQALLQAQTHNRLPSPHYDLILKDLALQIPVGACVGVIGKVGSGKSSLISALLGEMYFESSARVTVHGSMAYVSQKPWISSQSVRDVITFGEPFDQTRFDEAVRYSGMVEDLKMMPQGTDTMLGDRGINLSGGQKTRIAIARAFYSQRDIYLLDDPISALDVHVGKVVMEEGILQYLRGKTRVVATHALAYLPYFDYIYVLDEGRIVEHGNYAQISKSQVYLDYKKTLEEQQQQDEEGSTSNRASLGSKRLSAKRLSVTETLEKHMSVGSGKASQGEGEEKAGEEELNRTKSTVAVKTVHDKVIDHIISSEDKAKGDVVTRALLSDFIRTGGGPWFLYIAFGSIYSFT